MADFKDIKGKKITTPIGTGRYVWLNKPDDKWKEEGEFKANLIVPEAEAQPLIEVISEMVDEAYNAKYNELKEKDRKLLKKHYPFGPEDMPEGEAPSGNIEFKTKTSAVKKDKKTGEVTPKELVLVDRKGKPIDKEKQIIFSGSKLRISGMILPFYNPGTKQVGVTIYINAVQVIQFAERDALESYGFSVVEDEEDPGYPDEQVPAGGSRDPEDF